MELDQLIPEKTTWKKTIKGEGESREITLVFRPFDLDDEAWMKRAFGDDLQEKFEKVDMDAISRIAFHQLELESKRELMAIKYLDMDEDGNEVEVAKTGREKLGKLCVGMSEQIELLKVILNARGLSMPIVEKLIDEETGDLGNEEKEKVKDLLLPESE